MTDWEAIASKAEITARMGSLDQEMWAASPGQAKVKTETKTVKLLGVPITVAATTKWTMNTTQDRVTAMMIVKVLVIMAVLGMGLAQLILTMKTVV